jgi:predicted lipase
MNVPIKLDTERKVRLRSAVEICQRSYQIYTYKSCSGAQILIEQDGNDLNICFRGSDEWIDWLGNLRFWKTRQTNESNILNKVHEGFYSGYLSCKTYLNDLLRNIGEKKELEDLKIHFSGHSLGGAHAAIAVLDTFQELKVKSELVTFGCPRVGNLLFGNSIQKALISSDRILHYLDPVGLIPLIGYHHFSPPTLIWANGFPHHIDTYAKAIENLTQC